MNIFVLDIINETNYFEKIYDIKLIQEKIKD